MRSKSTSKLKIVAASFAQEMAVVGEGDIISHLGIIDIDDPRQSHIHKGMKGIVNGHFRERRNAWGQGAENLIHGRVTSFPIQVFQHFNPLVGRPDSSARQGMG